MPGLFPFTAARPNPATVDVASFLAPPYDVIKAEQRASLADADANMVEVTLPQGEAKYQQAAKQLASWLESGTLTKDDAAAFFLYEQTADVAGDQVTVRGLLAEVTLEGEEGVKPHERVYEDVVSDRLDLMRATKTDLEPIVAIYDGTAGETVEILDRVQKEDPEIDVTTPFDGDRHRLWRISNPDDIQAITQDLADRQAVIADGHHRWTTAKRASKELGHSPTMMMLLQDISNQGPKVLPIHRVLPDAKLEDVLKAIDPYFDIDEVVPGAEVDLGNEENHVFLFTSSSQTFRAAVSEPAPLSALLPHEGSAQWRRLDVAILHEAVFGSLLGGVDAAYAHTPKDVEQRIAEGGVGVLLRPTPLDAVLEVAGNGELMPRKSTFFLPKPVSGLVIRQLG